MYIYVCSFSPLLLSISLFYSLATSDLSFCNVAVVSLPLNLKCFSRSAESEQLHKP